MPEFKEKGAAYTAFVVPTECFEPFLFFQKEETRKGGKYLDSQPNFQLVFEVPNVFTSKWVLLVDTAGCEMLTSRLLGKDPRCTTTIWKNAQNFK